MRRAEVYARRLIARNVRPTVAPPATVAEVEEFLAQPGGNPPMFQQLNTQFGWTETAARMDRWAANGHQGQPGDACYAPQPKDGAR